jgi:CBS domain containing-hemolysin-like protein
MSTLADFENRRDFIFLCLALVCIFCAALAAGLTIGLVSMDRNALRLLLINGTEEEKRQVRKVLPLVKDRHWLLVTLFLFNATANEALPVFLEKIVPGYAAIVASALLVLVFGEIIPSSIFGGKRQLELAAKLAWIVQILFVLLFVIAKPIALFLDFWIGRHEEHQAPFNAKDLYTLLSLSAGTAGTAQSPSSYKPPRPKLKGYSPRPTKKTGYGVLDSSEHDKAVVLEFGSGLVENEEGTQEGVMNLLHRAEQGHMITINASFEPVIASEEKLLVETNGRRHREHMMSAHGHIEMEDLDHTPKADRSHVDLDTSSHKAPSYLDSADGQRILLNRNSVTIAQGAIVCSRKTVESILIPQDMYFSVAADEVVDIDLFEKIGESGFSRIIVYDNGSVIGYIVAKELLCHLKMYITNIQDTVVAVGQLPLHPVEYFDTTVTVLDALSRLKSGESRIAAVTITGFSSSPVIGFFSLEDIMEAIIQEEIEDEKDYAKFYVAKRNTSNIIGSNASIIGQTIGLF